MSEKQAPKITAAERNKLIEMYKKRFAVKLLLDSIKAEEKKIKAANKKGFEKLRKKYEYPFRLFTHPKMVSYKIEYEVTLDDQGIIKSEETQDVNLENFTFSYIVC